MRRFLLLALVAFGFIGCKEVVKEKTSTPDSDILALAEKGQQLMEVNCTLCHGAKPDLASSVAPPMIAIKAHYLDSTTSFEAFHESMAAFLNKPSAETAKMKGAIKRFGLMPYQPFSEETIKAIAAYMYTYRVPEPQWWLTHWEEKGHGNFTQKGIEWKGKNQSLDYGQQGVKIAMATKKQLGKNLMGKLQKEGSTAALEFCNTRAIPLTDSMSVALSAKVKRVSDKARNPNNAANPAEAGYISAYKVLLEDGMELKPIVDSSASPVKVYYPITTNSMCLKCHGKPGTDIAPATMETITRLYPADQAHGYGVNEIRGIWSITLNDE